jgi:formylglycine-generating enzyme required for sulfatase activity
MILIKGGDFLMGNESEDAQKDEQPLSRVFLENYHLSKSEITVEQYQKCISAGVCSEPHWDDSTCEIWNGQKQIRGVAMESIRGKNKPITCINWHQARSFAKWVGGDLPTEAQWEYAIRSRGKTLKYAWGSDEVSCDYTVMDRLLGNPNGAGCDLNEVADVCDKPKGNTEQGLCDMSGNVWEWILDEYQPNYMNLNQHGNAFCSNADCSLIAKERVNRGGGWRSGKSNYFRTTDRSKDLDTEVYDSLGFRVAIKVDKEENVDKENIVATHLEQAKPSLIESKTISIDNDLKSQALDKLWRDQIDQLNLQWIKIEDGSLAMGHQYRFPSEAPMHLVYIDAFEISKNEITLKQYNMCVSYGSCKPINWDKCLDQNQKKVSKKYISNYHENLPVVCISWDDARRFSKWIGGDLPTESQWEYVAKNQGENVKFPFSEDEVSCEEAHMNDQQLGCGDQMPTIPCKYTNGHTKQGVCDMIGNVSEWILDEWHPQYKNYPFETDSAWCHHPLCISDKPLDRVIRSGSFVHTKEYLHASNRMFRKSNALMYDVGFRVIKNKKGLKYVQKTLAFKDIPKGKLVKGDLKKAQAIEMNSFQLLSHEITVEQYEACDGEGCTPARSVEEDAKCNQNRLKLPNSNIPLFLPINCVSLDQSKAFAKWIGASIPTALEWEYAAKSAMKTFQYPWSGQGKATCKTAVIKDQKPCDASNEYRSQAICSNPKGNSNQGVCDLIGNVAEWVLDSQENTTQSTSMHMGGSFETPATNIFSYTQSQASIDLKSPEIGFRLLKNQTQNLKTPITHTITTETFNEYIIQDKVVYEEKKRKERLLAQAKSKLSFGLSICDRLRPIFRELKGMMNGSHATGNPLIDMRVVEETSKKYLELMYKQHEIAVGPMRFVLSDYADQGVNVDDLYDLIEKRCTQE